MLASGRSPQPKATAARWLKLLIFAGICLSLFWGARVLLRQQAELRRVELRSQELELQLQEVEAEAKLIEQQSKKVLSKEEMEEIARNQLGMLKQGEILFKDLQDQYVGSR